jgi:hypothetical protein
MAAGQEQCADIEGPLGAEVDAFIEQRGPHLGRGHVDEPVAVQHVEDRLLLLGAQGTRLPPLAVRDRRWPLGWRADAVPPLVAGLRRAYGEPLLHRIADLGLQVVLATSAPADELAMLREVPDCDDIVSAVTSSRDVYSVITNELDQLPLGLV